MTLQQRKARKFKEDLEIWDAFKEEIARRERKGDITKDQALELLKQKAEELDL